ncbi:MAG: radical SAM protein [Desulfurococcales archaeon]|nr:radical SAM protein [Desulfurococcales archaeon]
MSRYLQEKFTIAPSSRIAGLCHSIIRGEPYTTCQLACTYCYATWYRGPPGEPQPVGGIGKLLRSISKAQERLGLYLPVRVATLSDPFQPVEKRSKRTLNLLKTALKLEVPIILNTRLPPPGEEYWDLMARLSDRGLLLLQVTITGSQSVWPLLRRWEPLSPSPRERLKVVERAASLGVPVVVRVQPVIPGVTDRDLEGLISSIAGSGASGVIVEYLRVLKEVAAKAPYLDRSVGWQPYMPLGDAILHPSLTYRVKTSKRIRDMAVSRGLSFQTCKEGLFNLHTPAAMDCCGFSLLKVPTARRPHLWDIYNLARQEGPTPAEKALEKACTSNENLLCGERLEKLPSWLKRAYRIHERRLQRILKRRDLLRTLTPTLELENGLIKPVHPLTGNPA